MSHDELKVARDSSRVEAAAYRGRVTSLDVIGPWSRAARMQRLAQAGVFVCAARPELVEGRAGA